MCTCTELVGLLSEYLDGKLPAATRHDLEQHLSACGTCAAFVGTFKSTVAMLRELSDDDLPEELRLKLRAFLDGRSKS